jgi:hypothetical protein
MANEQRIPITAESAELAAGIDDVARRLRAVLALHGGFRRRSLPNRWIPPRRSCVGRAEDLAALHASLVAQRHVRLCGPRGIGKTTLLYEAAKIGMLAATTVPDCDGILWPRRSFRFADDLFVDLFTACYRVRPDAVVPDTTIRQLLRPVRALVVLDMPLPEDELQVVLDTMPDSRFVTTAVEPGLGHVLPLGGLSLNSSVRLVADLLGQPLTGQTERHLAAVWEDYDGHPGRLALLAGYLRTAGTRGADLPALTPEELPLMVPRLVTGLGPSPRRTLEVLAALPDIEWGAGLLAALSDTTEKLGARRLADRMLASAPHGRRYRLAPHVSDQLPADLPVPVTEVAARLTVWLQTARPIAAAAEATVIERTLEATLADGQPRSAMVLARAASAVIMNSTHWSVWRRILLLGLRAARAVGSVPDEQYFAYGLAAWATANRRTDEAVRFLELVIGARKDTPASRPAIALREQIEGTAFERPDLMASVAAPGLVARLARRLSDAVRMTTLRLGQLPGLQPLLRFAGENPIVARVVIGAIAAACATILALLTLPDAGPPQASASQTTPTQTTPTHTTRTQGVSIPTTALPSAVKPGPTNPIPATSAAAPHNGHPDGLPGGPLATPQPGRAPNSPPGQQTTTTTGRPASSPCATQHGPAAQAITATPIPANQSRAAATGTHAIHIDATATVYRDFIIPGITPTWVNSRAVQTLQLAVDSYGFQIMSGSYADFTFKVTSAGLIDYPTTYDGFLRGRGLTTLTVVGLPVTLAAPRLSGSGVLLADMPMTNADWIRNATVRMVPSRHYRVQQGSGRVPPVVFQVGLDGRVYYAADLDVANGGFLTGAGTSTLTFVGYPVCVDARAAGGTGVELQPAWGMTMNKSNIVLAWLLPEQYSIVLVTNGRLTGVIFTLHVNGAISFDPGLAPYLRQDTIAGLPVLTVLGPLPTS